MALFSTAVVAAMAALMSSVRGVLARTQEVSVVALSGVLASVATALPPAASEETRLATLLAAVVLGTGTIGLAAFALGWLRFGSIVRFIPYPVIGGFLAGTGWLIATGGLSLGLGEPLTLDLFTHPPDHTALIRLVLAIGFIAIAAIAQARIGGALVLPGFILAGLIAFNLAGHLLGETAESLRAAGWLVRLPESGRLWPLVGLSDVGAIDWNAILIGALGVPSMVVVSIIAFLMNATGIELAARHDLDIDRELRTVGLMNLVAGAGGGTPGFHSLSLSLLAGRLGAPRRVVGLLVALMSVAALAFGGLVLDAVPTFILGGLLAWVGVSQLNEWLVRSYRRISVLEYLLILLIFIIIVWVNFAIGILSGLLAAIVLFAIEYSQIDIVRHEMTGVDYQTGADSSEKRREKLQLLGDAILIIRLQGYLFFGTADGLRRRIQRRIHKGSGRHVRFVVLDFRRVAGLDSSAVVSFVRLAQTAEREGFVVVLTGLAPTSESALARGGFNESTSVRFESDIERGIKWSEDRLLADLAPELGGHLHPVAALLAEIVRDVSVAAAIVAACERIEAAAGEIVIERGAASDDILFIEAGHASVEIPSESGDGRIRLATVGPGAIVGEIAFYLGETRSASIIAEEPMIVWRFSRAAMKRLQAEAPAAALRFHEGMAAILAKRLTRTNRIVRFLAE